MLAIEWQTSVQSSNGSRGRGGPAASVGMSTFVDAEHNAGSPRMATRASRRVRLLCMGNLLPLRPELRQSLLIALCALPAVGPLVAGSRAVSPIGGLPAHDARLGLHGVDRLRPPLLQATDG